VVLHAKTNNMTDYQQTEEFKRREKESEDVQAILTTWNPLGSRSKEISDLDNYFTEANDILFHIRTNLHFPKKGDRQTRTVRIVRTVLNEAFGLSLTDSDCEKPAAKIVSVVEIK
ncbi:MULTISPECIES: hypothetical protein, partial [Flavobacteriaceae]